MHDVCACEVRQVIYALIGIAALLTLVSILMPVITANWTPTKVYPRLYSNDDFNLCPRCNMFHGAKCPSKTTYRYAKKDR